jgi:predicted transcriptional regulator
VVGLGKTGTIKQRSIYVYLPSIAMKARWEDAAQQMGTSLSKFVIEHVENSLAKEADAHYKSRQDLWQDVKALTDRVRELERERRVLDVAYNRLEEELRRFRAQPFIDDAFAGVRRYEKRLIDILRRLIVVSNNEILSRLGIEPAETEAVTAIAKQLENLEAYGLIRSSPRGWRWVT